ncbi:hypothetical protein FNV43_RR13255 [Rhamnella rubrinervis]|uniref:Protein VACUOLELESS1 n=1 Tax=Rhamnella rubrinervis TaxID=2594499 RepID=A0A8K0H0V3_9ROSA|nr:hypothetical protein FNV43_RR13255 [Rhamnella rubrinervis]
MANVSVAAEWQLLYNRYYRKPELYRMTWKHIDLSRNKLHSESALRKLRIFNCAGVPLSETVWKNPGGRLIGMAWTDDQTLACVVQDGTVYQYNIHAEPLRPNISMGKECFEQNVVDCVFWGNGVVCITESNQLFCIPDFKNPKPCKLAGPGIEEPPLCMAVIEPQYTMSGNVEVLLAVGEAYVLAVEGTGFNNWALRSYVVRCRRWLFLVTSALPPEQLSWCGMDTVLLYWDDMLLMMGPRGDPVTYLYDEPIILVPECDGVRILSNSSMEFLQRVPDSTESIFKIGSTSPAALLYDALDHFDRQSAKADENLRLIRSSLPEAVEACIDAAVGFGSNFQRDRIQEMCKILRVLNAVSTMRLASLLVYNNISCYTICSDWWLINAHQHLLALRISEYLGMNQEVVIMHWSCSKITASLAIPDVTLLEILLDKLKLCKGISYAAVAAHADKMARKLAALLVEHEPRSSKQVCSSFVEHRRRDTALSKATESGDTDLVYLVLFHIWQKRPALEFFGMIQARTMARDLFTIYARCYKHEFLKDFFLSNGQLQEVAFLLWKESWDLGRNPMASKGSPLHGPRIKLIEKAQHLFSETKEHTFESKAAEEHAKLLRSDYKAGHFVDSSISDTIGHVLSWETIELLKVKTEFKVSEKRWYWLKVFALATIRDWDALEKFSKEKRPPIGYRPFVEACIEADEKGEALKYIPKLADPRERAESYARIGMAKEAADAASQAKDGELLGRLKLTFSQNAAASSIFDTLRDRLSFQGVS